ncbi:MAG TPA: nicotinate (nicotinamide) nucleotide adenylyltransferase [Candidatus Saccharimonadales bacterium]|nr:nicotinate (nicotinamide) nucleotide adenylyltransferase [Candidatus Saccharimonadales bacterium]
MHIALLGGRFDPPHNGHLHIAREVLKNVAGIDEVWLIPANTHPWRPIVASGEERLEMVKFLEEDGIKASDIDIERDRETFTIDTIRELEKTTSNSYVFICGADQLKSFHLWKEYKELEEKLHFIVFPRIGYDIPQVLPKNFTLMAPNDFIATDDSSTEIREKIRRGESISHLVPKKIAEYILEKGLYK